MRKVKSIVFNAASIACLIAGLALAGCATSRPDAVASAKTTTQNCPAPPFTDTLFVRGKMNYGTPREDFAFQYRCNAYFLNVDLRGEQAFRIADAKLGGGINYGSAPRDRRCCMRAKPMP